MEFLYRSGLPATVFLHGKFYQPNPAILKNRIYCSGIEFTLKNEPQISILKIIKKGLKL